MKKFFLLIVSVFCLWQVSFSQMFLETFDHVVRDTSINKINLIGTNLNTPPQAGDKPYMKMTDENSQAPFQGDGYLTIDWKIYTNQSYGGYLAFNKVVPLKSKKLWDISNAQYLSIWYYNWKKSSASAGTVQFRLKLHDASAFNYWDSTKIFEDRVEDWYYQSTAVFDAEPGWKQLLIPLKMVDNAVGASPSDQGFSLPGWSGQPGDKTLNLDKIAGFTIEWTAPVIAPDSVATGKISFDNFRLNGNVYTPYATFEDPLNDKSLQIGWLQGASTLKFSKLTTDPMEGNASLQVEYKCDMPESWGGGCNFTYKKNNAFFQNIGGNLYMIFWYKNEVPPSVPGTVSLRFKLLDSSTTAVEEWFHACNINLDSTTTTWQPYYVPLNFYKSGDFDGDGHKGMVQPSWSGAPKGDGILNYDKLIGFVLEFSGAASGVGKAATGKIDFDYVVPNGYRETDTIPPVPPTNVAVTKGNYVNLITWKDVPSETGATYNVYYSEKPITDVKAKGVEVVKLGIPENTQLGTQTLRAPVTDQDVTYYYAVNAVDKVGNVGKAAVATASLTNKAKGVPTISMTAPVNFAADGKLTDWASIKPFSMKLSDGTAFVVTNSKVDGDADCSAQIYLAMDSKFLYVCFDVTDDVVNPSVSSSSWLNDAPDLFIGLYDWHGAPHTALDNTVDYHFRFNKTQGILDNMSSAVVATPGTNYYWNSKFPSGYVVEAKISLDTLAKITNQPVFKPQDGMRIPIDFEINDADAGEREGMLTYSPINEDKSYQDVSRWLWTWIGTRWYVSVNPLNEIARNYELMQNYPNPFNPSTQIKYSIVKPGMVKLSVYDMLGRQVTTLVNEYQNTGTYLVNFNGSRFASGSYFYRIESGDFTSVKKMLFVK
jgi:hypothetical protein